MNLKRFLAAALSAIMTVSCMGFVATAQEGEGEGEGEGAVVQYPEHIQKYVDEEGYAVVYVSASTEDSFPALDDAITQYTGADKKVVFALVDSFKWTGYDKHNIAGGDVVITAVDDATYEIDGGYVSLAAGNVGANIILDNIVINNHANRTDEDPGIFAIGNNLTLTDTVVINNDNTARTFVVSAGRSAKGEIESDNTLTVYTESPIDLSGYSAGGSTGIQVTGGVTYVVGGEANISNLYAAGKGGQGTRTMSGDVTVNIEDSATVNTLRTGESASKILGNYYINVKDQATVSDISFAGGRVDSGDTVINIAGGTVSTITYDAGRVKDIYVLLDTDNGKLTTEEESVKYTVKYNGDLGAVAYNSKGKVDIVPGTGALAVRITNGEETEVINGSDAFTAELAEGTTIVEFLEEVVVDTDATVEFVDEVSDGDVAEATYDIGTVITLSAPTAVAHQTFIGWNDGETTYNAEAEYTVAEDVVFTAVWEEDEKYTVTYANEKGAAHEAVTKYEGETITVANAPADVAGFTFVGWNNGETTYDAGDTFVLEADVTLTALWTEKPFVKFVASAEDGAAEDSEEIVYGDLDAAVEAPEAPEAKDHFTFAGWVVEGTEEIVDDFGVFAAEAVTYVATFEEDAKATVTIVDVNGTTEEEVYVDDTYTFVAPARVPGTTVVGFDADQSAVEATYVAGDEITVTEDVTFYVIREEIQAEEAAYTFEGRYDYATEKYTIEMNYVGPKANMIAFGVQYNKDILENLEFAYADELQTTGKGVSSGENFIVEVAYPKAGSTYGNDEKTPVLVGTFTADMTAENYAQFDVATDFVKYDAAEEILGAYEGGEWKYIMDAADFSLDVSSRVFTVTFEELVDDNAIAIELIDVDEEVTTVVAPTEGTMLEAVTFTVETAEGEVPATVTYYVAGKAMGALTAGDDGKTYTIPAENVLGDIQIAFAYLPVIEEVAITGIDAPEVQGTPDTDAIAGAETYTIDSVEWDPADETFGFNKVYTVKVTVSAAEGNAFSGRTVYTINGEEAVVTRVDKDTVTLSYTYEATAEELGTVSVVVNLVRAETDAAYKNFGNIHLVDAEGQTVATVTEGTEAGSTFVATFDGVLAGEYTVEFEKNGYLDETSEVITVVYNETTDVELTGVAGNIYNTDNGENDNKINLYDFARIIDAFEDGAAANLSAEDYDEYKALVDINEDGEVTVFDLVFVKDNYGAER